MTKTKKRHCLAILGITLCNFKMDLIKWQLHFGFTILVRNTCDFKSNSCCTLIQFTPLSSITIITSTSFYCFQSNTHVNLNNFFCWELLSYFVGISLCKHSTCNSSPKSSSSESTIWLKKSIHHVELPLLKKDHQFSILWFLGEDPYLRALSPA